MWTDNPERDFLHHDREQERALQCLPICHKCGHRVQDEHYYLIGGLIYCPECLDDEFMYYTEDYAS